MRITPKVAISLYSALNSTARKGSPMNWNSPSRLRLSWQLVGLAILSSIAYVMSPSGAVAQNESPKRATRAAAGANPTKSESDEGLPFTRREEDLPKGPTPRTGQGRPDLSGYWIPSSKDKPVGNIGKDLPAYKLPFTEAGRAALKLRFSTGIQHIG